MIRDGQKVLIVGAKGMLGSDFVIEGQRFFTRDQVWGTDVDVLDFTDQKAVFESIKAYRPTFIINAAAYTNVDGAETEKEKCFRLNVLGPENLVKASREFNAKLVHFTTDYIYSGEAGYVWTEDDEPCPPKPNYYAETKLEGERAVRADPNSLILRVQWLYGRARDRFSILKDKKTFTPFIDQTGAPTWTREVARTVFKLLDRGVSGVFNFAYDDHASWFEVYQFVKEKWGLDVELLPKRTHDVFLPARRPLNCVMGNKKICQALGVSALGSWKTPFSEFLK